MKAVVLMIGMAIGLTVGTGVFAEIARAQEATPTACAGFEAYAERMMAAGNAWREATTRDAVLGRDFETFSAPEWIAYATHFETLRTALKRITPPPSVAPWHDLQVERSGLASGFARTAATSGLAVAAATFSDRLETLLAERDAAFFRASTGCPPFESFYRRWDALDGDVEQPDATPAAMATPIPR